jgi:hypothetical protein
MTLRRGDFVRLLNPPATRARGEIGRIVSVSPSELKVRLTSEVHKTTTRMRPEDVEFVRPANFIGESSRKGDAR